MNFIFSNVIPNELYDSPIKIIREGKSYRMDIVSSPLSISESEFDYLYSFIRQNNLKYGIEIGTGFGISTLAIASALIFNGGKIVSIDSYHEEVMKKYVKTDHTDDVYKDSAGYKVANYIIQKFNMEDTIKLYIGWSPECIPLAMKEINNKLDFAFIDGMHDDESAIKDINGIAPFLNKKFALFFHDVHCFSVKVSDYLRSIFGKTYRIIPTCSMRYGTGYNLALLDNINAD